MEPATPHNAAQPKSRRRWCQYSLRTLLILVTSLGLPCLYLAREAKVVRDRRALIEGQEDRLIAISSPSYERHAIPLARRWLGDKEYEELYFSDDTSEETIKRFRSMFPEATVVGRASDIRPIFTPLRGADGL